MIIPCNRLFKCEYNPFLLLRYTKSTSETQAIPTQRHHMTLSSRLNFTESVSTLHTETTADVFCVMTKVCGGNFWHLTVIILGCLVLATTCTNPAGFQVALRSRLSVTSGSFQRAPFFSVKGSGESVSQAGPLSHIATIRCENFAGVTGVSGRNLELHLETSDPSFANLVVVTGETGHGKVSRKIFNGSALSKLVLTEFYTR